MPLLDHFHPPLSQRRHWKSFHSAWATALVDSLNQHWLPPGYFAEEMITVGGRVEIDVAAWDEPSGNGRLAVARKTWTVPPPQATMPGLFTESFSVQVYRGEGGNTLVGAVELLSPANKDRDVSRQAFAMKCGNYLHQGAGVVIVDIVTSRHANLHNVLVKLLHESESYRMADDIFTYAVAYRPIRRGERVEVDLWQQPLKLGEDLPTMPLSLGGAELVPVDLETTYQDVCRRRLIQ